MGNKEVYKKTNSTIWLEKIKQNNRIGAVLPWRVLETNISDSDVLNADLSGASALQTPNRTSPTSPNSLPSSSFNVDSILANQQKQLLDMQIELQHGAQAQCQAQVEVYGRNQAQLQALEALQLQEEEEEHPRYPTPQPTKQQLCLLSVTEAAAQTYLKHHDSIPYQYPDGIILRERFRKLMQEDEVRVTRREIEEQNRWKTGIAGREDIPKNMISNLDTNISL